jgi:hypothetical protein
MLRIRPYRLFAAGFIAVAAALSLFVVLQYVAADSDEQEAGDRPIASPARAKMVDGVLHVFVTQEDAEAGGIVTAPVRAGAYQETSTGFGSVLPPSALAEARQASQTAAAAVEQQELAVKAARLEVQRLRPLNRQDRIVSDKAVESAQATVLTEEAQLRLAMAQQRLQLMTLREQWGPTLADWLVRGTPQLDTLLSGQDLLVQIALPIGMTPTDHMTARLGANAETVEAAVFSDTEKVDPHFHGYSVFAVAHADRTLRPGMNVPVTLTLGDLEKGYVVPDSAVVRWQGESWIYVGLGGGEFVREKLDAPKATPEGWFLTAGLAGDSQVAIRGAQLLLSEELKAADSRSDP